MRKKEWRGDGTVVANCGGPGSKEGRGGAVGEEEDDEVVAHVEDREGEPPSP